MEDERQRIVRELWGNIRGLSPESVGNYEAAARLVAEGADPGELVRAMSVAAYEATFNTLFVLTSEEDIQALAESGAANGLHEDLLSADPTGLEGADLFRSGIVRICRDARPRRRYPRPDRHNYARVVVGSVSVGTEIATVARDAEIVHRPNRRTRRWPAATSDPRVDHCHERASPSPEAPAYTRLAIQRHARRTLTGRALSRA